MKKSNLDHLRDLCADNDVALEFIDAVESEIKDLKTEVAEGTEQITVLQNQIEDGPDFQKIDTGIGAFYVHGDNLLLQQIAEALAEPLKRNPHAILTALEALR